MKQQIPLLIAAFWMAFCAGTVYSQEQSYPQPPVEKKYSVAVRLAYFYPIDQTFRKIYGGGLFSAAEADLQIWKTWYGWASVGYFKEGGQTIGNRDNASLMQVPLSFGLKYIYSACWVQPYLGAGPQFSYVHEEVDSPFLIPSQTKWAWGGLFKTGVLLVQSDWLLDLFIDYSMLWVRMPGSSSRPVIINTLNASGLLFGAALGIRF